MHYEPAQIKNVLCTIRLGKCRNTSGCFIISMAWCQGIGTNEDSSITLCQPDGTEVSSFVRVDPDL